MEITKFSSQLFATLEQVTVYLWRAPNTLTKLGNSALEKTRRLQETRRATDLREVLASSLDALVVTSGKITKFSSQLFATLEQVTVYLWRALNTLAKLGKSAFEKTRRLQETRRATDLREVLVSSLDAIVVTSGKITKFSSQLFATLEQVTVYLWRAPNTLAKLGKSALEKTRRLQETRRATDLREVLASDRCDEWQNHQTQFATFCHFGTSDGISLAGTEHARETGKECLRENPKTTGNTSRN